MLKRFFLSFLVITLLAFNFLLWPSAARAQAAHPWYSTSFGGWYTKVYDTVASPPSEIFGERYTAAQVDWIIWSVISWLPTKIVGPGAILCFANADVGQCFSTLIASGQASSDSALALLEQNANLQQNPEKPSLES